MFGSLERDGTLDHDDNGYTDIEEYLNGVKPEETTAIVPVQLSGIHRKSNNQIMANLQGQRMLHDRAGKFNGVVLKFDGKTISPVLQIPK